MKRKGLRNLTCALVISMACSMGVPTLEADAAKKNKKVDTTYVSQIFDADYYYNKYDDVAKAFGMDPAKLLEHYVTYGIKEGRDASDTFNATTYKNNYADLRKAFGSDMLSYCRHYVEYGVGEGRNAKDEMVVMQKVDIGTVVGTYSSQFNPDIARATNVRLAAEQVNGRVLQPQEKFSFLGSITPRTRENGYVVATVFSGGKVSKGIGGGICQVSSTLYAAVLGTDCIVNERHAHSLPVSYMPKGMDATVSSPSLDFQFTNTYDQPMLITVTATEDGTLTVTLSLQ